MTPENEQLPRVGVVDDDASIRFSLEVLLQTKGFQVDSFDSGEALLAGLDNLAVDCLLVDVWMPGLGGIELVAMLKDRGLPTPVILLTGHGDGEAAERGAAAGAVCVLPKPCETDVLLGTIRSAIAGATRNTRAG